jgi:hypothetical protein
MAVNTFALSVNSHSPSSYISTTTKTTSTAKGSAFTEPVYVFQPPITGWYVFFVRASSTPWGNGAPQLSLFDLSVTPSTCNDLSLSYCPQGSTVVISQGGSGADRYANSTITASNGLTYGIYPFYMTQTGGQKYAVMMSPNGSGFNGEDINYEVLMSPNSGNLATTINASNGTLTYCSGSTCVTDSGESMGLSYFLNTTLASTSYASIGGALSSGVGYWTDDLFNSPTFQAEFASSTLNYTFASSTIASIRPLPLDCDIFDTDKWSNCIENALVDVFYPSYDALNTIQTAKENLFTKVPFGYATLIYEPFTTDLRDPTKATLANVVLTERLGNATRTITIIDWSHMTDFLTSPIMTLINQLAIAGIYLGFSFWAFKHITKKSHI